MILLKIINFIKWHLILNLIHVISRFLYSFNFFLFCLFIIAILLLLIKYFKFNSSIGSNIDSMTGLEFELYLKKLIQRLNYKVKLTPANNDQGADLILEKNGNIIAVQEVVAAKEYYNCNKAIVVTKNTYTKSARELAKKCNVSLWDGKLLIKIG
jgi:hypothetical protein